MADDRVDIFMPLYVRDYLTSTIGWTAEERGHYTTLLFLQWDRFGLPADLAGLERLSPGVGGVWALLEPKFPIDTDGQRRNHRLEEHREKALDLRRRRSEAAERANRARWGGSEPDRDRRRDGSQTDHDRIANGSDSDPKRIANGSHPPSPSPSYEEKKNTTCSSPPSDPPRRRKRSAAASAGGIVWDASGGWQGITDEDRQAWRQAYPAADLAVELAKATEWLRAHPAKAHRSNWRRFVAGWLTRCQDRGGTHRDAPGRPAAQIRIPRPEFGGRQMSDEEFARAKRSAAQQQRLREEREAAERERRGGRPPPAAPAIEVRGVREEFDQAAAAAAAMAAIQGGDHADM
jgi:hypothetical protein